RRTNRLSVPVLISSRLLAFFAMDSSDRAALPPEGRVHAVDRCADATKVIEPMLLLRRENLPDDSAWEYQRKLDGYCAIAFKTSGRREAERRVRAAVVKYCRPRNKKSRPASPSSHGAAEGAR